LSLVLAGAASTTVMVTAPAPALAKEKAPTLSAKVGKPLQEASSLMEKNELDAALAKVQEVAKMEGKTPFETVVVDDYLGRIYLGMKDYANAAAAFDASYATGAMRPEDKESRLKVTTQLYLQAGNYPKAVEFGNHYLQDVGQDPEILGLIGQAQYMNKDLQAAGATMKQAVSLAEAKNVPVREEWLHYIEHAEADAKNITGVIAVEQKIVQLYPSKENWSSLLTNFANNIKGSDKVTLDIYRLMLATDTIKSASEYMEAANLAMSEQLPGIAKRFLDQGFSRGILSTAEQKALLKKATAAADADSKTLASTEKLASAQKTGDADVKFGEAYASYGQYDAAIAAIQRGISKGVKDRDDAQLRLGLAYLNAGRKAEAVDTFKQATSNSPSAQIARVWAIFATPAPAPAQPAAAAAQQ
jgi:tetratricopeptide (TPR) repeat protein